MITLGHNSASLPDCEMHEIIIIVKSRLREKENPIHLYIWWPLTAGNTAIEAGKRHKSLRYAVLFAKGLHHRMDGLKKNSRNRNW